MKRKIDSEFRQRYVRDLYEIDAQLAHRFSALPKDTQRRWITLMTDYGIKVRDAVRALHEYLSLIPANAHSEELACSDEE